MSVETPKLLSRFSASFVSIPGRGSGFTLSKYLDRSGNVDPGLKKLAEAVSPNVYAKYARTVSGVSLTSFARFLQDRCCEMDDTLNTPEYKKASNTAQRREAIASWLSKIKAFEKSDAPVPVQAVVPPVEDTKKNDVTSSILSFYGGFTSASAPLKKTDEAPIVVHSTPFVKSPSNIVVQPPAKQKKDKKTVDKIVDKVAKPKPQKLSPFQEHMKNLETGNNKAIPRKDLEALAAHMEAEMLSNDGIAPLYAKAIDLIHTGFDRNDPAQLGQALQIAKENGINSLPRRERRDLVDLFTRGSQDCLDKIAKQDGEGFDFVVKNIKDLRALADNDLLRFAPKIADIFAKNGTNAEKQTFVLGHNETPVLRLLLNKGADDKLIDYMGYRCLASNNVSKTTPNKLRGNGLWDAKLSTSAPYTSKDGKIVIYASMPFRDNTSYFRSWAKDCCEDKGAIFLAPTDEVLVSGGIINKCEGWTETERKNFVLAHQVKSSPTFQNKLKAVASGTQPWITDYKLVQGGIAKAIVKTKIIVDQASDRVFVPVSTVLC
jgi:hypothetical protein